MAGNTFGTNFRLTTFGESHGPCIGGVIDGCPAGLQLDLTRLQNELARRRPGQSTYTTPRNEADVVEFLSGLLEATTTGTPIGFMVRNKDQRPTDYDPSKDLYRPSHADYSYMAKYGIRDHRGSGRSSARETVARVAAGAIARQMLDRFNIRIGAYVSSIGPYGMEASDRFYNPEEVDASPVRCPDPPISTLCLQHIQSMMAAGDTCGGIITCVVDGVPPGIGDPVFDKLSARLSYAMMGINAAHGFEYGSGFAGSTMKGSDHNDSFEKSDDGSIRTATNRSGGILGGISNGMPVVFRVAFKPVSSIRMKQSTVDLQGAPVDFESAGRHDPCVVPRAVPIVEAMAALTLADLILSQTQSSIRNMESCFN